MRLSRFFIDRPVFAGVLSIAITLMGAIAALRLPVSEYPEIAPPTVQVTALYPGASAETIAATVAYDAENRLAVLTPSAALLDNTPYRISVNGVQEADGTGLEPFTSVFSTLDAAPPKLTRKSIALLPNFSFMRPSCGTRFSAMSSREMTLMREASLSLIAIGGCVISRNSPSMRKRTR